MKYAKKNKESDISIIPEGKIPAGWLEVSLEEYEYQKELKRRENLKMLSLTAADVERAIYKAKGMDFDDILELVKDNPDIDIKALKIEFKANNFYRGNPYIEQVGALLGFTPEMLDRFFESNEWEELVGVNMVSSPDDEITPPVEKGVNEVSSFDNEITPPVVKGVNEVSSFDNEITPPVVKGVNEVSSPDEEAKE